MGAGTDRPVPQRPRPRHRAAARHEPARPQPAGTPPRPGPQHAQGHRADNRPDLLPWHAMPYNGTPLAALLYWCAALGAAVAIWLCASPPPAYRGLAAAVVAALVVVLFRRHPPCSVDQEYPDEPNQIQQKQPCLAPTLTLTGSLLDASQVAAAIRSSMSDSTRPTLAVSPPQADSSDSDGGGSSTTGDETNNFWYTSVHLLDAGDARLIVPDFIHQLQEMVRGLPEADAVELLRRAFRDANKPDGFYRLCEVVEENQWIIYADPHELTDRSTGTSVMTMKITAKLIHLIWLELDEQNWMLWQEVKKECFREVVGQSVEELLDVALSFSNAGWSADHPLPRLTIIDVLVDVLYNIRELPFSRTEFIHDVVAHVFCKMVIDLRGMLEGTTNDMRRSREDNIHPVTVLLVRYMEFFRRNGGMMQSVLGTGDCSIELTMIDSWVSKLSKDAQVMFPAEGQRHIYMLNNIYYVYQLKHHPGPGGFVANIELQRDLYRLKRQYINSYLDECWVPLVRYLDGDSLKTPWRLSLDKFLEEFFTIYDSQITWKVRTRLKERLRKEIVELVVPEYANFLQVLQENPSSRWPCWLRGMRRARSEKPMYTAAWLELVIRELYER